MIKMIITIIIIFKVGAQLAVILSVASRSIRLRHIIDLQDTESRYFVMTEFNYLLFDHRACYFGGARSKGFATFRNVSKLTFWGQDWARQVCGFSVLFGYLTN